MKFTVRDIAKMAGDLTIDSSNGRPPAGYRIHNSALLLLVERAMLLENKEEAETELGEKKEEVSNVVSIHKNQGRGKRK